MPSTIGINNDLKKTEHIFQSNLRPSRLSASSNLESNNKATSSSYSVGIYTLVDGPMEDSHNTGITQTTHMAAGLAVFMFSLTGVIFLFLLFYLLSRLSGVATVANRAACNTFKCRHLSDEFCSNSINVNYGTKFHMRKFFI